MEEGKNYRISNSKGAILIAIAGVADVITLIPVAGDFVGPIFWICASIYFWKSGLGFVNVRRLATSAVSTVAEMIPVVQEFPTILLGMIVVVIMVRTEDKTGISVTSLAGGKGGKIPLNQGGTRGATTAPPPMNDSGVRAPNGGLTDNI